MHKLNTVQQEEQPLMLLEADTNICAWTCERLVLPF